MPRRIVLFQFQYFDLQRFKNRIAWPILLIALPSATRGSFWRQGVWSVGIWKAVHIYTGFACERLCGSSGNQALLHQVAL